MPYPEAGPAPVVLVVIGHVGVATDQTASGTAVVAGGSGYGPAVAAASLLRGYPGTDPAARDTASRIHRDGDRVGLVAQVGPDFDQAVLHGKGIDLAGVAVLPGTSPRFVIRQLDEGTRLFESDLGVAASPRVDLFPDAYLHAGHVHLGTAPPRQQLTWLRFLRAKGLTATISVDMFEHFVSTDPDASRKACDQADFAFMNETEYDGLYGAYAHPKTPIVLKHGAGGAEFVRDGMRHRVDATQVLEVDPIGAGEVLAGVYLALRARGLSEVCALQHAVAAATASVTEFGMDGPRLTRALDRIRADIEV